MKTKTNAIKLIEYILETAQNNNLKIRKKPKK